MVVRPTQVRKSRRSRRHRLPAWIRRSATSPTRVMVRSIFMPKIRVRTIRALERDYRGGGIFCGKEGAWNAIVVAQYRVDRGVLVFGCRHLDIEDLRRSQQFRSDFEWPTDRPRHPLSKAGAARKPQQIGRAKPGARCCTRAVVR